MYHSHAEERHNTVNSDFSCFFFFLFCKCFINFPPRFYFLVVKVSTSSCIWKSIFSLLSIAINKWFSLSAISPYVINQERLAIQHDITWWVHIRAGKKKAFLWLNEKNSVDVQDHFKMISEPRHYKLFSHSLYNTHRRKYNK